MLERGQKVVILGSLRTGLLNRTRERAVRRGVDRVKWAEPNDHNGRRSQQDMAGEMDVVEFKF